ncbi:MAG: HesB/IscA family protein, partial [Candidatus Methylomirabilales bacterium]
MLTITDAAKKKILALFEGEEQKDLALRVAIRGRGPGGFRYELQFVGAGERGAEDTVVNAGGFDVLVDPDSAPNLKG